MEISNTPEPKELKEPKEPKESNYTNKISLEEDDNLILIKN